MTAPHLKKKKKRKAYCQKCAQKNFKCKSYILNISILEKSQNIYVHLECNKKFQFSYVDTQNWYQHFSVFLLSLDLWLNSCRLHVSAFSLRILKMKKQNYVQRHFCRVSPIFFGLLTQETKKKEKKKNNKNISKIIKMNYFFMMITNNCQVISSESDLHYLQKNSDQVTST